MKNILLPLCLCCAFLGTINAQDIYTDRISYININSISSGKPYMSNTDSAKLQKFKTGLIEKIKEDAFDIFEGKYQPGQKAQAIKYAELEKMLTQQYPAITPGNLNEKIVLLKQVGDYVFDYKKKTCITLFKVIQFYIDSFNAKGEYLGTEPLFYVQFNN